MYFKRKNIGVLPIAALVSAAPGVITLIRNISKRPAGEFRDRINAIKPQIANTDARTRLSSVIATSQQNFNTINLDLPEWLVWYRQNYPNDYMELLPEDKAYWNTFLDNYRQKFLLQFPDLQNILNTIYFTNDQINYKLKTPGLPGTQKAGMNIWVTLAIVGAGIFAISKMKK